MRKKENQIWAIQLSGTAKSATSRFRHSISKLPQASTLPYLVGKRVRGDGAIAFDDAVGEVSGTWVRGRKPMTEVGLLFYIMVDDVAAAIESVVANGGKLVQPIGADAPEITARFSDPAGNIIGLYQEPK